MTLHCMSVYPICTGPGFKGHVMGGVWKIGPDVLWKTWFFFLMFTYGHWFDEVSVIYEDKMRDLLGSKVKILSHPDKVLLPSFPL